MICEGEWRQRSEIVECQMAWAWIQSHSHHLENVGCGGRGNVGCGGRGQQEIHIECLPITQEVAGSNDVESQPFFLHHVCFGCMH